MRAILGLQLPEYREEFYLGDNVMIPDRKNTDQELYVIDYAIVTDT